MLRSPKVHDVTPQEAIRLQDEGAVLLDVREDEEWTAGHAPGAVHVPLAGVGDAADRFADREVVTVCRSGRRSVRAAELLARAGMGVRNIAGGMSSWASAGLSVVCNDGSPGAVA